MKFGLENTVIERIQQVFEDNPKADEVLLFGSRAKGNYRENSDIDLALKGKDLSYADIVSIGAKLDELNLPYEIDLLDYKTIGEPALVEHIDRVGIVFWEGWKKVKLRDVVSKLGDGLHGTPKYDTNGEYYFINGNNLVDGKIVIKNGTQKVSEAEYLKYKKELNDRTILLGINGTIGNTALYNGEKCVLGKSAGYFNVADSVDKYFIKYVISDNTFQSYIETFANGSTIKNVSLNTLREYEFYLPPLKEQKAIASTLSSLDDKIDLLQRQNKTLEELAELIFQEMFVEKLSKDWEVGNLEQIASFHNGKSRPKEEEGEIPVYGGNGILGYSNVSNYDGNSIIIGRVGAYCGSLYFENKEIWVSDNALLVKARNASQIYFLFNLLKRLELNNLAEGSSHPLLTQTLLKSIQISIPPKERIDDFELQARQWHLKIDFNNLQIQSLRKLRDSMLPKLMNREIRLKN